MHASSSFTHYGMRLDGLTVLSVDDDRDTLYLVRTILEDAGAVLTTVESAREGFETLQRERPALLLSDISMPHHDGFWLIAQVRALPPSRGGKTPAAALTSLVTAEDRARILRAGFQHHIPNLSSQNSSSRWSPCWRLRSRGSGPPLALRPIASLHVVPTLMPMDLSPTRAKIAAGRLLHPSRNRASGGDLAGIRRDEA
jgi:CheY-like chemotaxis protein